MTIAYFPQNTPPVVRSINVSGQSGPKPQSTAASTTNAYSITVTDAVDTSVAGTPSQTISRGATQQIQVVWQADDPDGDRLIYNLYFRGEDESQWKLLRADMTENTYTLDARRAGRRPLFLPRDRRRIGRRIRWTWRVRLSW